MQKDLKFTLPEDFKQHEFIRELQDYYLIQQEKTVREQYVYYDTFDWRLYNKSLVLCSTAQTLLLQSLDTTTVLARAIMTVPPVLLSDFPGDSLQEQVAPIIARSYWIPGSYVTRSSRSAGSNALPRLRTLCPHSKNPR